MNIDLKQLPEGEPLTLIESLTPEGLDVEIAGVHLVYPIEIKAQVLKLQEVLDIKVALKAKVRLECSRCLVEIESLLRKDFRIDCPISKADTAVDITEDIRQELILEYPLKPLCTPECKGLCAQCGKNLNEGDCKCVSV
ncbi:MAG: hypothetical protein A2Y00_08065 [Omnitrophica WOR_2 bacterium GWF2_43_52]|nr:MAG: hypothetical protein A2Y01_03165 [Omnitrophica WOR_2 bacterium GWC2_44_8]OGX21391.1 MAG: hypothetical protein A2Y00_08065 [Omnitrophica WOR_2 bacterium GWF2_43_52]OGX54301.1 MAG: hypothetical protein A2460_09345 [Omnitrophica WOR_2 bacterium RIFOXYC2_FULL_43_9]HAH21982.1 hypothetical protein [Candidatus Omnitrophota bacterium]HBG62659.1 hypothetical protein [Candidatus Omnitrophota bacterium]